MVFEKRNFAKFCNKMIQESKGSEGYKFLNNVDLKIDLLIILYKYEKNCSETLILNES